MVGTFVGKEDESAKLEPETPPPDVADLAVAQKSEGPVMPIVEYLKMGPGPSSSDTMGPMRITYDFDQHICKLAYDQLKRATGLKVHLFGSLSTRGKGHDTDRASLAGLYRKSLRLAWQSSCSAKGPG